MVSEKNILYVLKSAQPGGMEFHVLDLVKGFSKANRVYVMVPDGPLVSQFEEAGATVLKIYPKSSVDFKFIISVRKFCRENRAHIVHTHELISSQALIGALLAGVKKRVYHVHTPFLRWKYRNPVVKFLNSIPNWIYNFLVANFIATDVIALTRSIKLHRVFFEMVFPSKIRVIPNSVDVDRFSKIIDPLRLSRFKKLKKIPENRIIFGVVSRITAEKGYFTLIKAFKMLNDQSPRRYFLLLAGGGDLMKEVDDFCRQNFPTNYLITDRFDEEEKTFYLQSMDYFVFPSLAEGFGYVPLEALSSRIPTLVSNLPVLRDVLGKSVSYFTPNNVTDLHSKMVQLIKIRESDKEEIVKYGLATAREYTFDAFIKNYTAVYGESS